MTLRAADERLSARDRSIAAAAEIRALVFADQASRAVERLRASEIAMHLASPRAWGETAALVGSAVPVGSAAVDAPALAACARVAASTGDFLGALRFVAVALRRRPALDVAHELRWQAAACYEKLGHVGRALASIRRALRAAEPAGDIDPAIAARLRALRARCWMRQGDYSEASAEAERALADGHAEAATAAALHETLGVSLGGISASNGAAEST